MTPILHPYKLIRLCHFGDLSHESAKPALYLSIPNSSLHYTLDEQGRIIENIFRTWYYPAMNIEHHTNPFQPHTESESLDPKEVTIATTDLLNSFEEYMRMSKLKKKHFTEHRLSDGWEWQVEFNPGETKKTRELLIQRREENSKDPFTIIVIDALHVFRRTPNINEKGTLSHMTSYNTEDIVNQATEFVEAFTHPTES
jgi:hypothetical protein